MFSELKPHGITPAKLEVRITERLTLSPATSSR